MMKFKNWISLAILLSFEINASFAQAKIQVKTTVKDDVNMAIKIEGADKNDTLVVWLFSHLLSEHSLNNYKEFVAPMDQNQRFNLAVPLNEPGQYFLLALKKGNKPRDLSTIDEVLLPCYYAEKGDKIMVQIAPRDFKNKTWQYHHTNISFAGIGSAKYESQFKTDSLIYHSYDGKTGLSQDGKYQPSQIQQDIVENGLKMINDRRSLMSENAFNLVKTDFVYHLKNLECESLNSVLKKANRLKKVAFKANIENFKQFGTGDNVFKAIAVSQEYTKYQLNEIKLEALLDWEQINTDSLYFMIKNHYHGELLDRVICLYFNNIGYRINNYHRIVKDALMTVKRPEYLAILKTYENRILGSLAYDFSLQDTSGKLIYLHQFKGKVIVMDFWFTGCAACTKFYKNKLNALEEKYRNDSLVVFVSICVDSGKDHWLKSVKSGSYTSDFVVNLYTGGLGLTDPVIQHYNIYSNPQPIILDKTQRIKMFGNAETLKTIDMIQMIDQLRSR